MIIPRRGEEEGNNEDNNQKHLYIEVFSFLDAHNIFIVSLFSSSNEKNVKGLIYRRHSTNSYNRFGF